jgi:glycolate oxidase FAD binding subunit
MTTPSLLRSLADVVGAARCLTGAERAPYVVDGRTPAAVVFPASADEVARVVRAAAAAGASVVPWGGGTLMQLGAPPPDGAVVVVTRRLAAVLEHEPGDLTATVEAGLTLEGLQRALGARGQWVPLDPPAPEAATLGGVLAANAAGPRRQLYGTARDLVIGIRVVSPEGDLVRAGGRVVKNVAGYDLVKLYIGALGTLGIIVDATLKLRPRPEAEAACWAVFPGPGEAAAAARALAGGDLGPAALELLDPRAAAAGARHAGLDAGAGAALLVAFDGLATTVAWQGQEAARLLRAAGAQPALTLDAAATARALAAAREVRRTVPGAVAVARVGVLPADLGAYLDEAAQAVAGEGLALAAVAHAGQGLATLLLVGARAAAPPAPATAAALARCRDAARARGGHLAVESAPLAVREICPVWDPPGPAGALMRGLKARLDPAGIMNPGRFVAGL